MLRDATIARMAGSRFDVAIVGGGINGAAAAAALSSRGVSVALVDRGDFGGFTSQESSNLVWGGIKYLQEYEFPLVWSLCGARNKLMRAFPSRIREVPFLAAVGRTAPFSPALGVLGASAYWGLGRFRTRAPRVYSARQAKALEPLLSSDGLRGAVQYGDARLIDNDARFVWEFIRTAMQRGVAAANYVELRGAERAAAGWRLSVRDLPTASDFHLDAEVVINAAGPFATGIADTFATRPREQLALSKGVHLIVPRLSDQDRVLAFFDEDGRLFYVIPMHDRTVIGTTDTRVTEERTTVTAADRRFILDQANRCLDLSRPLVEADIIAERCGVRSLVVPVEDAVTDEDWMALSRRHAVDVDRTANVISILGGKLTDCINIGDEVSEVVAQLGIELGPNQRWYGEPPLRHRARLDEAAARLSWPSGAERDRLVDALWRRQGVNGLMVIERWRDDPRARETTFDGVDVTRGEFSYMLGSEMVVELEDLLRRRTPIGQIRSAAELSGHPDLAELSALLHGRGSAAPQAMP